MEAQKGVFGREVVKGGERICRQLQVAKEQRSLLVGNINASVCDSSSMYRLETGGRQCIVWRD